MCNCHLGGSKNGSGERVWSRAWQYFHEGIFEENWVFSPGLAGRVMPQMGGIGFAHQLPRSF